MRFTFAVTGFIGLVLTLGVSPARSQVDVLGQADARIHEYRTGEARLRLVGPGGHAVAAGRHVKIEQTRHKFLFGSNIFMLGKCRMPADNEAYAARFAELLNYATAPFYWWIYESFQGRPNYSDTDKIIDWCAPHHVTLKGHPLAWNFQDPSWLPAAPEIAMGAQLDRVQKCVRQFKGKIDIWDAVNEATQYDRPETRQQAPILTEAIRRMGVPDYIRAAFRAARNANPEATLVINDYRTDPAYSENVISKLTDKDGHPLNDVIGIQCHQHRGAWTADTIWEICERFASFGKPLHFTETTILSGQPGWDLKKNGSEFKWESTPEGEQRQADEVERFYTVLFSHPAVEAITWWDFSDQGAWQGAPAGLLRADMTPKPAYQTLLRLIKGKWWTRVEVPVGTQGEARYRGFFGDYKIAVEDHGRELTGTFTFDKTTRMPIEVQLK